MRRIIREKKQTNAFLKKERDDISRSVNVLKQERELLGVQIVASKEKLKQFESESEKQTKDILVLTEKLLLLNTSFLKSKDEILVKEQKLKDLILDIERLEEEKDAGFKRKEEEMTIELKKSQSKLSKVNKEILIVQDARDKIFNEKAGIEKEINILRCQQEDESRFFLETKKDIVKAGKELEEAKEKIKEIQPEADRFKELKDKKEQFKKELIDMDIKIKNKTAELVKLDKGRDEKMVVVLEKEKMISYLLLKSKAREDAVNAKEKRIMDLGKTLQKHYDRQQIPIKVF